MVIPFAPGMHSDERQPRLLVTSSLTKVAVESRQARALTARVVERVMHRGRLLDAVLEAELSAAPADTRFAALVKEMAYGTLRWAPRLEQLTRQLLERSLQPRDQDIAALLMVGLYQLLYMRVQPYAAVTETVAATETMAKPWAKGLVNACLRRFLREKEALLERAQRDPVFATSHPQWLLDTLRQHWPSHWQAIVDANNARAPMSLRVNLRKISRNAYLARLRDADLAAHCINPSAAGVVLETPVPVSNLPGFAEGLVSIQDAAAQLAVEFFDISPDQLVLDACAAPGGKLAYILERCPHLKHVVALDNAPARLQLIKQNLARLQLDAEVIPGDARAPAIWWDGELFDRILVDAPCSATGVIRRHPDIKAHRTPADLEILATLQADILEGLWPLLKSGGKLLYVTCSVLPIENELQVNRFLANHGDAKALRLSLPVAILRSVGTQLLPGQSDMDGFYYASLQKS
ncbi:MAG: 16S rRNA (cytosine(967)-C(5))-methyltransferase RsmB [Acidiferrobacterales bacterium]